MLDAGTLIIWISGVFNNNIFFQVDYEVTK